MTEANSGTILGGYRGPAQTPAEYLRGQAELLEQPGSGGHWPPIGDANGPQWPPTPPQAVKPRTEPIPFSASVTGTETQGAFLVRGYALGLRAKTLICYNTSNHVLMVGTQRGLIPPQTYNYPMRVTPELETIDVSIYAANAGTGDVIIWATEEELPPMPVYGNGLAGTVAGAAPAIGSNGFVYNGSAFTQQRTPTTVKNGAAAAAGATSIWTPAAGKKFRVMRFLMFFTNEACMAAAGECALTLLDNGSGIGIGWRAYLPITGSAATTIGPGPNTGWVDLGNGILSAAANNPLQLNIGTALTGGVAGLLVAGTEE